MHQKVELRSQVFKFLEGWMIISLDYRLPEIMHAIQTGFLQPVTRRVPLFLHPMQVTVSEYDKSLHKELCFPCLDWEDYRD